MPHDDERVQAHREKITALQSEKNALERRLQKKQDELADALQEATDDRISGTLLGSWLVSPRAPQGVTRQQVNNIINGRTPKPSPLLRRVRRD